MVATKNGGPVDIHRVNYCFSVMPRVLLFKSVGPCNQYVCYGVSDGRVFFSVFLFLLLSTHK